MSLIGGLRTIRIGTRGSQLARWQAGWVATHLRANWPGLEVELVEIRTSGDRDQTRPLAEIGGQGLFTKEIQQALLDDRADVAVHSLKDLPSLGPEGLLLAAVPPREDTADALIAPRHGTLAELPEGAAVGTGSGRRRAQLLHLRPDLDVRPIRGNVETRLKQAIDGQLDGVVLAEAGLRRLGLETHITERLGPPRFLPAVGQGALGLECRARDEATRTILAALDDPDTHAAVLAERALMRTVEAGCMLPLGAWGRRAGNLLHLDAAILDPDGRERIAASGAAPPEEAERIGAELGRSLLDQGARRLIRGDAS